MVLMWTLALHRWRWWAGTCRPARGWRSWCPWPPPPWSSSPCSHSLNNTHGDVTEQLMGWRHTVEVDPLSLSFYAFPQILVKFKLLLAPVHWKHTCNTNGNTYLPDEHSDDAKVFEIFRKSQNPQFSANKKKKKASLFNSTCEGELITARMICK